MSTWMKTDFCFDGPIAVLTFSKKDYFETFKSMMIAVADGNDDPHKIAAYIEALIVRLRPDLAGGSLFGMRYDFQRQQYEFQYFHPSFERIGVLGIPPVMPLIQPTTEAVVVNG